MNELVSKSEQVKRALSVSDIHDTWERDYRIAANNWYYKCAFDYIAQIARNPQGAVILDAGAGPCYHSCRLVERGFRVEAIDFSGVVVAHAQVMIAERGLAQDIKLQQADILDLPFEDSQFDYALCWGVLMHIPNIERAVSELARVLKPGGMIVLEECNMHSVETRLLSFKDALLGRNRDNVVQSHAGLEFWVRENEESEPVLVRDANIPWLIEAFGKHGFTLYSRIAGQFTELYTRTSNRFLCGIFQTINRLWFTLFKGIPAPAYNNILILKKTG